MVSKYFLYPHNCPTTKPPSRFEKLKKNTGINKPPIKMAHFWLVGGGLLREIIHLLHFIYI